MGLAIDTDPALGIPLRDPEDGVALLYVAASGAEIEGVTVCFGNVPLPRAFRAARRTLGRSGREIAILPGASGPGDLGRPTEASRFLAESLPRGCDVAAIAPLTNIATALRQGPGLAGRLRRLVVRGGMVRDRWRFLPDPLQTEFNFWKDPGAAAEVLATGRVTLVPAEV